MTSTTATTTATTAIKKTTGTPHTHVDVSLRRTLPNLVQMQFGNSDMYFICRLMPKGSGVGALDITKCRHEIADACWMSLDQFKKQTRHSMLSVVANMLQKPEETELTRSGCYAWCGRSSGLFDVCTRVERSGMMEMANYANGMLGQACTKYLDMRSFLHVLGKGKTCKIMFWPCPPTSARI